MLRAVMCGLGRYMAWHISCIDDVPTRNRAESAPSGASPPVTSGLTVLAVALPAAGLLARRACDPFTWSVNIGTAGVAAALGLLALRWDAYLVFAAVQGTNAWLLLARLRSRPDA